MPDRPRLPPPAIAGALGAALIAQSVLLRRQAGRDGRNTTLWTLLGITSVPGPSVVYVVTRPKKRRRGWRR
jgi:hypothetical protein